MHIYIRSYSEVEMGWAILYIHTLYICIYLHIYYVYVYIYINIYVYVVEWGMEYKGYKINDIWKVSYAITCLCIYVCIHIHTCKYVCMYMYMYINWILVFIRTYMNKMYIYAHI
jgi:hypothetical protein